MFFLNMLSCMRCVSKCVVGVSVNILVVCCLGGF